jgi:N6-adenosine-specific RNA methylase IME4
LGEQWNSTDKFGAILADPPWPYLTYSARGNGCSAEAHYDRMAIEDICKMPVGQWAAPDCALFLWVTKPILPRVFDVIASWGFHYKTVGFTWIKTHRSADPVLGGLAPPRYCVGLGHWTRANPEMCLLAIRGHPHRLNADVAELVVADRREHSRKPDQIYEKIERLVPGPYLELFACSEAPQRDGWVRWVGKERPPRRRWRSNSYPGAT